ncbi:Cytochrome c oxidase polypeptide 1 [Sulfuracidifex tepidarius]|uniref:Cytochrome c oxidase polypeptide 1 n=1 Tax=Sulfuracidifex tepidarius TaxID=1294262 RepID=A0A510DWP7_9CREN|nr:cbb3-type cytochrome c oxidase subunit I [Sulfuracidifex tepidarius]BBG24652.1 Cytochrome c oxidase polypeptide 1 [Sulfuracidifex tepidarius]
MGLKDLVVSLFQLDKDWTTRIVMGMLVMSVIWGLLGVIDALMVRIQEAMWGISATLPLSPQEYFASITLHGARDLFPFAQQLEFALFIFFTIKLLNIQPRAKWLLNIAFIAINISPMFMEGPIVITGQPGFDNYFPSTSWYYLSPLGIPGYSQYVASITWYIGWILLDSFTYLAGIWIVYHYYLATKQLKEKLPVVLVFFLMDTLLYMIGYSGVTVADVWDVLAFYHITGLDVIANQVAFWIFGHAIVYMAWLPAVGALYLLIPVLANKPLYSDRMGRISALLYLIFSNNVPIHHLYMVNLPLDLKLLQEALTYAVVIPSMMTFFNLWATAKGAQVNLNLMTAWSVTSFAGAIAAGVTGISNATISFDAIIHNTMYVVGHFHAMILWSIVPAAFAVLYFMIPMMTGRSWYSRSLGWIHFVGYMIGTSLLILGFEITGFSGLLRRTEIYPLTSPVIEGEVMATVGAFIADFATLLWFLNLVLTLVKGEPMKSWNSVPELISEVAMSFSYSPKLSSLSSIKLTKSMLKLFHTKPKKGLGKDWSLGILGAFLIVVSTIPLALAGDFYTATGWIWIFLLTLGIVITSIFTLKAAKTI